MIHIENDCMTMHHCISCLISLPFVPRVGDIVRLDENDYLELYSKAKSNLNELIYYTDWFYGESYNCEKPKYENLKDLSFDDAIRVSEVEFVSGLDVINIELSRLK